MRRVFISILVISVWAMGPPASADGRDAFLGLLQGVLGEIDRQQAIEADRRRQHTSALIDACYQGADQACLTALQSPLLNPAGRRAITAQRRAIADQKAAAARAYQTFVADWTRCREAQDRAACEAALTYPQLSDRDRGVLLSWRQAALDRAREAERQAAAVRTAAQVNVAPPALTPAVPIETAAIVVQPTPARISFGAALLGLSALAVLLGVGVWALREDRDRMARHHSEADAPFLDVGMATPGGQRTNVFDLPMTGHVPTDVRRVLAG